MIISKKEKVSEHLRSLIPRGSSLSVFCAGSLLESILPDIVKAKKCRLRCFSCSPKFHKDVEGVVDDSLDISSSDLLITESSVFTDGGALFNPVDLEVLPKQALVGVGFANYVKRCPAHLDFVPLSKVVSELGVLSPDIFVESVNV